MSNKRIILQIGTKYVGTDHKQDVTGEYESWVETLEEGEDNSVDAFMLHNDDLFEEMMREATGCYWDIEEE